MDKDRAIMLSRGTPLPHGREIRLEELTIIGRAKALIKVTKLVEQMGRLVQAAQILEHQTLAQVEQTPAHQVATINSATPMLIEDTDSRVAEDKTPELLPPAHPRGIHQRLAPRRETLLLLGQRQTIKLVRPRRKLQPLARSNNLNPVHLAAPAIQARIIRPAIADAPAWERRNILVVAEASKLLQRM